jgi:hypothetical protein
VPRGDLTALEQLDVGVVRLEQVLAHAVLSNTTGDSMHAGTVDPLHKLFTSASMNPGSRRDNLEQQHGSLSEYVSFMRIHSKPLFMMIPPPSLEETALQFRWSSFRKLMMLILPSA